MGMGQVAPIRIVLGGIKNSFAANRATHAVEIATGRAASDLALVNPIPDVMPSARSLRGGPSAHADEGGRPWRYCRRFD